MSETETHARIVAAYTDMAIEREIISLRDHKLAGVKGTWQNLRITALRAEMAKRDNAERSKP